MDYICVRGSMLIAQILFVLERRQTDTLRVTDATDNLTHASATAIKCMDSRCWQQPHDFSDYRLV